MQPKDLSNFNPSELPELLSNEIYTVAVRFFEHAEHRNLIHGNGHHMAQELAGRAYQEFKERLDKQANLQPV